MATDTAQDMKGILRDLDITIRSRFPIISIVSHEEIRIRAHLKQLVELSRHHEKGLYIWCRVSGLSKIAGTDVTAGAVVIKDGANTLEDPQSILEYIGKQTKGIFILADYGPYLTPAQGVEDSALVRQLRELAWKIKSTSVTIFLVGAEHPAITSLEKEITIFDYPLPSEPEVEDLLDSQIERLKNVSNVTLNVSKDDTRERMINALIGMTEIEIESALAKAAVSGKGLGPESVGVILDYKKAAIRQSGALTYAHPEDPSHQGGYALLRQMLQEAAITFTPSAQAYGVKPSKGMLLVGLPGVGKDLTMAVASSIMGKPLLKMDFGSVMGEGGGILGQAEASVERALKIASTIKGILGISEFEKAVGGLKSSGRTDGGTTARVIATLLNWMQDQDGVFVLATANDVRQLAPEQVRTGRFSRIVFVDFPNLADRADIFRAHLSMNGRTPEQFDLESLAKATRGFSGAEIQAVVEDGILSAYMAGAKDVTEDHMLARASTLVPTSVTKAEEIDEIRIWAKEHLGAVNAADADDDDAPTVTSRELEI